MIMLNISGLTKTYPNGVKALNGINLSIPKGMFGLLGPNGAGKSSLMRTIATLQTPDTGTIQFDDIDVLADPNGLRTGAFGVPEPDPRLHAMVGPDELDLCLCPGLGFTRGGVRLGRGKASYDSVLPQLPSTVFRVGIAFELQVRDSLPREAHDVLMTHLGTEEGKGAEHNVQEQSGAALQWDVSGLEYGVGDALLV